MLAKRSRVLPPKKYVKRSKSTQLQVYQPMYKTPKDPVRFVKRHADFGTWSLNNIVGTTFAWIFRLNQVPAYTELTALYDRYKINAVELTFYPRITQLRDLSPLDNPLSSRMLSAVDFNDVNPAANADELREREDCQVTCIHEKHVRYIPYPKILDSISSNRTSYIATSSPSTTHYGLKTYAEATGSTGTGAMSYTVEVVFYLSFKDLK